LASTVSGVIVLDRVGLVVVQFLFTPALQRIERLEAGDTENPCGDCRTSLESSGLPPDVKEHIAVQLLRNGLVTHRAQHELEDPDTIAREQSLHGGPVALGDLCGQDLVRNRLHRRSTGLVH
jgi:hypothetical protein